MWTVVYREDRTAPPSHPKAAPARVVPGAHLCARNDLSHLLATLLEPPRSGRWFAAVADSGKIHTLPYSPLLEGGAGPWRLRFERQYASASPAQFAGLLWHAASLYAAGFVKRDIASGEPHPSSLAKYGVETWRQHDERLRPFRGLPASRLAIWMLRKDMIDDQISAAAAVL
jgi:hypothetical protein